MELFGSLPLYDVNLPPLDDDQLNSSSLQIETLPPVTATSNQTNNQVVDVSPTTATATTAATVASTASVKDGANAEASGCRCTVS